MRFTLDSDEGLPIRGDLDVPRNAEALVVIVHGFKGFKDWGFFPWLAEYLCDQKLVVCRFNMSRSGIGENPDSFDRLDLFRDDTYSTQLADLRAVIRYAQSQAALPAFLLGHSRGGGVALLGASGVANLHGVITWSAISHVDRWDEATKKKWRSEGHFDVVNSRTKQVMPTSTRILDDLHHDIVGAASQLEVPLLVMHGGRDESVPVEESREIVAGAKDFAHVIIGTATHTYNAIHPLVTVPRELSLAAAVTGRFIAAHV